MGLGDTVPGACTFSTVESGLAESADSLTDKVIINEAPPSCEGLNESLAGSIDSTVCTSREPNLAPQPIASSGAFNLQYCETCSM